ncbi:hypothetical protein ABT024_05180 [Streptomyces sp. NPDC002812]|uniref:hypothetical protein n=1 Tax=Streptomyces sp. NPDC002812 TaxID=3154434 RepID=UPI0033295778
MKDTKPPRTPKTDVQHLTEVVKLATLALCLALVMCTLLLTIVVTIVGTHS